MFGGDAGTGDRKKTKYAHLPRWAIAIVVVYVAMCACGAAYVLARMYEARQAEAAAAAAAMAMAREHAGRAMHAAASEAGRLQTDEAQRTVDDGGDGKQGGGEKKTKPAKLTMLFGGDVLLHRRPLDSGRNEDGSYSYEHFFEETADLSRSVDVAVINQEGALSGESYGYQAENYIFNSPQTLADAEMDAGYDVILKAMNHVFDMGYDGLHDELAFWHDSYPDVPVIGVADPHGDEDIHDYVHNVYVREQNGLKVAILNYTYGVNLDMGEDQWEYCGYLHDEEKIAEDMQEARDAGADFVIVCPHWGVEYQTETSDEETRMAQYFADLGADAVVGGHPHLIQRTEVLNGDTDHPCVVFYSMGNYVASALDTRGIVGAFAELTLKRDETGRCWIDQARFVPTIVCDSYGKSLRTYLASDWTDELAATTDWPGFGRGALDEYLRSVLGDDYDAEEGELRIEL